MTSRSLLLIVLVACMAAHCAASAHEAPANSCDPAEGDATPTPPDATPPATSPPATSPPATPPPPTEAPAPACEDKSDAEVRAATQGQGQNCGAVAGFCEHPQFASVIQGVCPKTCGTCRRRSERRSCEDKSDAEVQAATQGQGQNCGAVAGFCEHPQFASVIQGVCPKTCGTCPEEAPAPPPPPPPATSPGPSPPADASGCDCSGSGSPAPPSGGANPCGHVEFSLVLAGVTADQFDATTNKHFREVVAKLAGDTCGASGSEKCQAAHVSLSIGSRRDLTISATLYSGSTAAGEALTTAGQAGFQAELAQSANPVLAGATVASMTTPEIEAVALPPPPPPPPAPTTPPPPPPPPPPPSGGSPPPSGGATPTPPPTARAASSSVGSSPGPAPASSTDDGLGGGAIAGIIIAVVVFVCCVGCFFMNSKSDVPMEVEVEKPKMRMCGTEGVCCQI